MLKSQNLFRFSDNSEVLKFEQEAAELLGMQHRLMVLEQAQLSVP